MSKTVLTVDDSRTMRDMLLLALQDAGYTVIQAVDGVDGLETLAAKGADVVITDINMPRMDGYGFIEGMRADPNHRTTPRAGSSSRSTRSSWSTPSAAWRPNPRDRSDRASWTLSKP